MCGLLVHTMNNVVVKMVVLGNPRRAVGFEVVVLPMARIVEAGRQGR